MASAGPITIGTSSAATLVNTIVGGGVTIIGTPTYIGSTNQSATFTNGADSVGIGSGIVLTSGLATGISGANTQANETLGAGGTDDNLSTNLGTPGNAQLTAISGFTTWDAAVLDFDFQFGDGTSVDNSLFFNFVFASEEYLDYVNTAYNDVFAFFVDGVNIGLVPGDGPITVNNVNPLVHSAYYINNIGNTNGYAVAGLDIKYDGLTTVITATKTGLAAGTHHMTFAVADASDHILDAGVFIQAGTFSSTPTTVPDAGSSLLLLGIGLAGLRAWRKR
jgi:hypothetical protein